MSEATETGGGGNFVFDLDGGLDDIPDLPSFKAVPTGAYICNLPDGITFKAAEASKKTAPTFHVKFVVKEIAELKEENLNDGEDPPKPDDVTTMMFQMDNETGAGFFKRFADPISEALGSRSYRELMKDSKGIDVLVAFRRISGKGDKKDNLYNQILNVEVV